MNAYSADAKTADYWLTQAGWRHRGGYPGNWTRKARKGSPAVACRDVSSDWQGWYLTGAPTSCPTSKQILTENESLSALCKFTNLPDGTPGCRFDLPLELLRNTEEADPAQGISSPGPLQAWTNAVTTAATGRPAKSELPTLSADELALWLENHGWASSTENETVLVNVPLPGLFCQIVVDSGCPLGTRLWCQLVDMTSWSDVCRDAARAFATVANQRLRLVRLASVAEAAGELLQAEIILPSTQIPGAWLEVALESLHAAIRLTARELSALRDPELAKWTLAAMAAERTKEVGDDNT